MRTALVLAMFLAVSLAGCTGGSDSPDGRVFFNGVRDGGFTQSDSFTCDQDARVTGLINGAGKATITIKDGAGATKATLSLDGTGQDVEDSKVTGTAGEWTINVRVTAGSQYYPSGFSGQYNAQVYC